MHNHGSMRVGGGYLWTGIAVGAAIILALHAFSAGWLGGAKAAGGPAEPFTHQGDKVTVPANSPLRSRIVTAAAGSREIGAKLTLPAVVEADPAHSATILPPLSGRVVELKVALGDHVAAGQLLALIDSPDLAQAYDDYDRAADLAELTEKNRKRQESQFTLGVVSEHDLDQARSDATQAKDELTRAQSRLRAIGAVAGDKQRLLAIRAPSAGDVTALSVAQGAMITDPTQSLMTIANLSKIWVTALVPEKLIGQVAKDQPAEVRLDAFPGKSFAGKVLFVSALVEPDSRRNKVRIAFANDDGQLKPNMFATVTLKGAAEPQVVLPTSALLMNNDRTTVFVATGDWIFERRVVSLNLEEGTEVAILSGVKPGEMVVIKGGILIND